MPVTEIDAATLRSWLEAGSAVIIDVREPDEHAAERIPGSRLLPLSRFDPAQVPPSDGIKVVLHCRTGRRSADAAARLLASGRAEAIHLRGGIEAWKAANYPVERAAAKLPLPIMRQVQIVAGGTVLLGSILAYLISPLFLLLTGFFGAGLLFAGLTGTCGMATMLRYMPWNRAVRQSR